MSVIHLEITSFRGISPGAIHYYGQVRPAYDSHYDRENGKRKYIKDELKYVIEQKHIDMMDELCDPRDWERWMWEVGNETGRFFSKEDVIEAAIKLFNEKYDPNVDVLTTWKSVYMFNRTKDKFLAGSKDVIARVNSFDTDRTADFFLRSIDSA